MLPRGWEVQGQQVIHQGTTRYPDLLFSAPTLLCASHDGQEIHTTAMVAIRGYQADKHRQTDGEAKYPIFFLSLLTTVLVSEPYELAHSFPFPTLYTPRRYFHRISNYKAPNARGSSASQCL